jgi:LysM repeat protein/ABC-type branched-subunit amino acid transport system substrate-binding protein
MNTIQRILPITYLLVACLWCACASHAQISQRVEVSNGVEYILHTAEKGQTLYAISKLYQCDINEISAANPGIDQGVKEGQVVRIPKAKVPTARAGNKTHEVKKKETLFSIAKQYDVDINLLIAANPGSDKGVKKGQILIIPSKTPAGEPIVLDRDYFIHKVQPGETMYSISRRYNIEQEAISRLNDGLKEGLKADMELRIPGHKPLTESSGGVLPPSASGKVEVRGAVYEKEYDMALMLPFYATYKDTMESRDKKLREVSLQMMRGAMMAADTLEKYGLKANVHIYDVLDNKKLMAPILAKPEMGEMDVVIGPTFKEPIKELTYWAKQRDVHVVIPVQQPATVLLQSPNMSKAVAGTTTQWITTARYIHQNHKGCNLVVINSKNLDDMKAVNAFKDEWKALTKDSVFTELVVADVAAFNVKEKIKAGKKNIVVVPTNDKKVINALFRTLGDGDIIVFGNESWEDMENISVANRNKYQLHFPQTTYYDQNDAAVNKWMEQYRKRYRTEPGKFAALGYDLVLYYGMGLKQYGHDFPNHLSDIKAKTIGDQFVYYKTGLESGFENQYVHIIGTSDYEETQMNQ